MKQEVIIVSQIPILAIGASPDWNTTFFAGLKKFLNQRSGTVWKIKSCSQRHDRIVETVLANLDHINSKSPCKHISTMYALLRLHIETDSHLEKRIVPWIEDEIRNYVAHNEEIYSAGYFFYPILLQGKPSLRIFACCHSTLSSQDEVTCGDDFSYILRLSEFLHRHLYHHDADVEYPDIVAALLLQFGSSMSLDSIAT